MRRRAPRRSAAPGPSFQAGCRFPRLPLVVEV
jgi:hypothetical protein